MPEHILLYLAASYLLGAVPCGFLVCQLTQRRDIRQCGSGNIGAANVLRTSGRAAAICTLVFDVLKGVVPVLVGMQLFPAVWPALAGGAAAVMGHIFPVFLKFRGGKGVAALLGVYLVFDFPAALAFGLAFFVVLAVYRFVSAGSLAAVGGAFFVVLFSRPAEIAMIACLVSLLVVGKHSANIHRMLNGVEYRFQWNKHE